MLFITEEGFAPKIIIIKSSGWTKALIQCRFLYWLFWINLQADPISINTLMRIWPVCVWCYPDTPNHTGHIVFYHITTSCFKCNIAITKFLVSHTCEIRFHDVIGRSTLHMYSNAKTYGLPHMIFKIRHWIQSGIVFDKCHKRESDEWFMYMQSTDFYRFDSRLGQYSFRGLMIVIATGLIPLPSLSIVSTMVMWESSHWFGKNILQSTG